MNIQQYISNVSALYSSGKSTEHSYRGDLQQLLISLLKDVSVTNEPKRIECGAPDYILTCKEIPVGYIEAKDVGVNLGDKIHKEQFDRYRAALNNLIITDYLGFHFYKDGVLTESVFIGEIGNGKVHPLSNNFDHFTTLIQNFAQIITQSIKSPEQLAKMMASKARLMANVIFQALEEDDKNEARSELQSQREAFKNILIHDIDNLQFADIYAQTIAYGLFAARYHDPTLASFSREEAARLIPHSNPFLRKLFQTVATYSLEDGTVGQRLLWIVEELVQVFLATDVAKIMKNFGRSTRQQDPVVHFYETFLAEYDPKLRKARGVWYTPEPVVDFIVRAVDDILKTKFNLPLGLADTSKVKRQIESIEPGSKGQLVKKEKEFHKVQILDPATGTGTFLAKTIEHIYETSFANQAGAWPAYVKESLIPRLNGFELLMTSYAMAHLKIDMLLSETGYKTEETANRLRIYLTNSLEEHHPDTGTLFSSWLSSEANEANHIKRDAPVMVVMGNPPYSVSSSNKSEWIQDLLTDYKKNLNERKINLDDDYIKFIRFGQHYIDKNGEGVLAYISNNSFIDGITHRQMRKDLLESFDEIYILDLHGNSRLKEVSPDGSKDENVFDIMQGVSINLFVKTGKNLKGALGKIFYHEIYGKREAKYNYLKNNSFIDLEWKSLDLDDYYLFFKPKDLSLRAEYEQGFKADELYKFQSMGVLTSRDNFVIDDEPLALASRIKDFIDENISDSEFQAKYNLGENYQWKLNEQRRLIDKFDAGYIKKIDYRPFDTKYIYFQDNVVFRSRKEVMQHLLKENFSLNLVRLGRNVESNNYFISKNITDKGILSSLDNCNCFPLYIYTNSNNLLAEGSRVPNLNMGLVDKISTALGLQFSPEKTGRDTFAPIDLLDYIYAVLHSTNYRETYKEFLKIDFPRVPYPKDKYKFWELVALGAELRQLHLLEGVAINQLVTQYPVSGSNSVDTPRYEDGKVYINDGQYFDGVPKLAWGFYIGGYQPAQKWLKDRKGKVLSFEDILHYQKIIKALIETCRIMEEIDGVGLNFNTLGS
jgi:predicted helicase